MFSFTNKKKVTGVWNSEVDSVKKISKMADFQVADVLLLVLELTWSR